MTLAKPSFDYYRIDEVPGKLKVEANVDDLLRWGAENKLQFSVRLKPEGLVTNINLECTSCGAIENVPEYSEVYPLSVNTLNDILGDTKKIFIPRLVCSKCKENLTIEYNCDANHPCFNEDGNDNLPCVNDLLVHSNDISKFNELYCATSSNKQTTVSLVDNQQVNESNEKFPGLPGESRIYGLKKFAGFFGLTDDYLKHIWKKEGYPFNKDTRTGRLYTFQSQLEGFFQPKTKK